MTDPPQRAYISLARAGECVRLTQRECECACARARACVCVHDHYHTCVRVSISHYYDVSVCACGNNVYIGVCARVCVCVDMLHY